jgi:hypothetical protein
VARATRRLIFRAQRNHRLIVAFGDFSPSEITEYLPYNNRGLAGNYPASPLCETGVSTQPMAALKASCMARLIRPRGLTSWPFDAAQARTAAGSRSVAT